MNLRDFIDLLDKNGYLITETDEVAPNLEMAKRIYNASERPVLFTRVSGCAGRVAAGLCSRRAYFALALGITQEQLLHTLSAALKKPVIPPPVSTAPCQEVVEQDVDLTRLPILTHLPTDGAPYVTAGVVIVKDRDYGRNMSIHRLMLLDRNRFAARLVEKRGTATALAKSSEDLEVAICIGNSPHVLLAAAMSPPMGVDELSIAHALRETPLVKCRTVDLEVPAASEWVLEGRLIKHETANEGPFLDLTGTLDIVRQQPVIEIQCITHRRAAIYQALLPGGMEHKLLMGLPREPTIYAAVSEVCTCRNVVITPGGASWLHAVVQIEKHDPEDGKKAIRAAFEGHSSLKHVVVVDEDINIYDMQEVEWAIATRFQADQDLLVFTAQPSSSLDPSAQHIPGQKARTSKMGIDATIPWHKPRAAFKRVRYDA